MSPLLCGYDPPERSKSALTRVPGLPIERLFGMNACGPRKYRWSSLRIGARQVSAALYQGPEFRHLEYFLAVAEEMKFSKAARRLSVAQPSLSQQVQQLEEGVGTKLFARASSSRLPGTPSLHTQRRCCACARRRSNTRPWSAQALNRLSASAFLFGSSRTSCRRSSPASGNWCLWAVSNRQAPALHR